MQRVFCWLYSVVRLPFFGLLVGFLWIVPSHWSFASEKNVLRVSLEDAVQAALQENFKLSIGQYELKKARISRNASWFALLPSLSLSASHSIAAKKPQPSPQNPTPPQTSLSASLGVSIGITATVTKNLIGIFKAFEDYKFQKITFDKLVLDTAIETQKLYFDLVIAQKKLNLLKEQRAVSEVDAKDAEREYRAGLKDEYAMLKTKLTFLKAKQAYDTQINKEADTRRSLLLVMGHKDMNSDIILSDGIITLSKTDIESMFSLSSAGNAQVASLRANLQSLKIDRWSTAFNYLPAFSFGYSLGTRLQNADSDNWFDGDKWKTGDGAFGFSVSINVMNYLPWSSTSQRLRALNASIKQQEQKILQKDIIQQNKLRSLKASLKHLIVTLKDSETQLTIAKRAYELVQEGYKNGLVEVKEYLNTKAELHNEQIQYITQQVKVVKDVLDIKALTNNTDGVY